MILTYFLTFKEENMPKLESCMIKSNQLFCGELGKNTRGKLIITVFVSLGFVALIFSLSVYFHSKRALQQTGDASLKDPDVIRNFTTFNTISFGVMIGANVMLSAYFVYFVFNVFNSIFQEKMRSKNEWP